MRARFGAWYELFPRSWGGLKAVEEQIPAIADLGFDVLYFPPIHPIGRKNRKGRNNTLVAGPDDPGSPYAIGAAEGGHDAVHPELGTMDDVSALCATAHQHGMDVCLDLALNASADHPWLSEHPEWFLQRPDGTLKYAENPPKRYQDIYNFNWDTKAWRELWEAWLEVLLVWVRAGVKFFRVDNPHTKPFPFWEWLIDEVHNVDRDVIFLAEAFTRRAVMRELAKLGFTQSYTYFTWKNSRWELTEYVNELAWGPEAEYFRPNFFPVTPDILHAYLQHGGPPAFVTRLVLAATLSPSYGIYSGYENFENVPVREGSEEYLNSEKYEIRERTLDGPLLPMIRRLNEIRRENPALQILSDVHFLETQNDGLIAYAKQVPGNCILVVVNLDPHHPQEGARDRPGATRPAARLRRRRPAHRRPLRLAHRRQLRPARSGRRPGPHLPRRHVSRNDPGHWFEAEPLWFKTAVFYEIHTRAFFDANGDGSGDFRGLIEKLDYLQWLGVDCIWLLPFYKSPLRDGGYDISDFFTIQPDYGTVDDVRDFIEAAHQRGIRVIADLVMNHTSSDHPWFQESRSAPDNPKRDWYVWSDTVHRYEDARIIFTDTETSNWTWDDEAGAYFWHRFFSHQPDLNFDNPEVQEAMLEVLRFWLDLGMDGFRLDAVPYLYERDGTNGENLPETHEYLKRVRAEVDANYPDRVLLAEANQWPADVVEYFGEGDECHMAFHFPVMPRMFMALRREEANPIYEILRQTPAIPDNCQWGLFLRNHDELTLEMVTDEERDYMYGEYAKDPRMKINVGIRRRLAPLLDGGRDEIELMHAILFSLPGSPVLYYGDEIMMGDNVYLGDRDGVRTPMQWTGDRNGGFSRADFAQLYAPPLMDPVYGFQAVNVEAQLRTPTSLLRWLRRFISLRKEHPVFGLGTYEPLEPSNNQIFAHVRTYEDDVMLCVHNLARSAQAVELDLSDYEGRHPVEVFGRSRFPQHRRAAVPAHAGAARLLLVPARRGPAG